MCALNPEVSVHPLVAVLAIVLATGASLVLMRYVYRLERHHPPTARVQVLVGVWFLATYGLMAFAIRPG
jgi:hypothetical protein